MKMEKERGIMSDIVKVDKISRIHYKIIKKRTFF